MAKPPGSGRKKGTLNRQTVLAREGLKSAIEIVREASRFLRNVAVAFTPPMSADADPQVRSAAMAAAIKAMPKGDLELVRKFIVDAANVAYKAAEFGCAKLARIDYVGDAPQGPARVENTFEFVLNIGNERPGRPVEMAAGVIDGYDHDDGHAADRDRRADFENQD